MRIWVSRNSEVPLRDQLKTQLYLGVLSKDLRAGQKLPSTRELAMRLGIHSNTVSAAYRDLVSRGCLEHKRGSGVYVRAQPPAPAGDAGLELELRIAALIREARLRGFSLREIRARLKRWLDAQAPDHFLLIEPDPELRNILVEEVRVATGFAVSAAAPDEVDRSFLTGAIPVFLFNKADQIRKRLPPGIDTVLLQSRSVTAALATGTPIPRDALVAVASRWPDFLKWARDFLVAAGADPDALSFRDASRPGWRRGLAAARAVITDALTAQSIPAGMKLHVFPLIADASLAELRRYVAFVSGSTTD